MRTVVTPSYTFTPGGAGVGKLAISGIANFDIRRLLLVVDITTQVVVYAYGIPVNGATAVNGSTLTLAADTSTCASSDTLSFIYDDGNTLPAPDGSGRLPVSLPSAPMQVQIVADDMSVNDASEYSTIATELLGQSFDASTNVRQQVDIPGLVEVGANGGIKTADCKGPFVFNMSATAGGGVGGGVIDTAGYNMVSLQFTGGPVAPNFAGSLLWSNDGITFTTTSSLIYGVNSSVPPNVGWTTTVTGANQSFIYGTPCHGRFLKIAPATGSSSVLLTVMLRNMQLPTSPNLAYLNNANMLSSGLLLGALPIQGPNAIATASNQPPVITGGAAADGLVRRTLLDTSGRTQVSTIDAAGVTRGLTVLPPALNPQNIASLPVQEVGTAEGSSRDELLLQILRELQITNFYLYQLNAGSVAVDEPSTLRAEPSLQ